MSDPHEALGRRLFAVVRRERPAPELREKVLALGRAERARAHSGFVQRGAAERRVAYWTLKHSAGWSLGLAACAALVFVLAREADDAPSIVMSAEHSSAPVVGGIETPSPTDESGSVGPSEAAPEPSSPIASRGTSRLEAARTSKIVQAPTRAKFDAGTSAPARLTLGEQLVQIKTVRAALRAGDPVRALSLLDAYESRAREGELGAEASLLRIEALAAMGRRDEAAELARKFATDHPNSPLIDRALAFTRE